MKAFLDDSAKSTTPAPEKPPKIDSEALQIAKRSNVLSVLAGFGSRMLPKGGPSAGLVDFLNSPIVLMGAGTTLAMLQGVVTSRQTHASVR